MATRVTWGGHSTVLIETAGARLLTDPALRMRIGHLRRRGAVPPGLTAGLDAVLISHLHHDHLDLPSLRRIDPSVPLVLPRGGARALGRAGRREVREVVPGDTVSIGGARVAVVEADHHGGRATRRASAPALGYVVTGDDRVYFAGDTDVFAGMAGLGALDVALVPIWGWGPSLGPGHLDPESAAHALTLLRPRIAVPIHWGTLFAAWILPPRRGYLDAPGPAFAEAAARLAPGVRVVLLRPGGHLDVPPAGGARADREAA